ncbi:MAG TPA: hypothetical protein VNK96_03045 [Fimbriimonadales bacterium]|nr:hypothetical protein [Fimbriimonadales bacterium]
MKTRWLLISVLIVSSIASCQPKPEPQPLSEGATASSNVSETEKTKTPQVKELASEDRTHAFPSELLHEGARYFGAPFEKPVRYRIKGGGEALTDTRTVRVVSVENGVAKIEAVWKGKMAERVGTESYEINKDGVYAVSIGGASIQPKSIYLPAELTKGKTWTTKYSFTSPQMGTLSVESKYKVIGKEKVKVSLGAYDAIVVSETGTLRGGNISLNVTSRSYFAEGIGVIKLVSTQKGKVADQPREIRLEFEAISEG